MFWSHQNTESNLCETWNPRRSKKWLLPTVCTRWIHSVCETMRFQEYSELFPLPTVLWWGGACYGNHQFKSLLKKDPSKGLLAYRSIATPFACGYSPSHLLTRWNSETPSQPSTPTVIQVGLTWRSREAECKEKQRLDDFNQQHNVVPLKAIQRRSSVYMKDTGITVSKTETAETTRSYMHDQDQES